MRLQKLDEDQVKPLKMPRGSLKMPDPDGRVLQPIIGYDIREINNAIMNKVTRDGIKASAAWYYQPTRFIISATLDETRFGVLMHVSMSYPDHDPTWTEIKMVRALFFPSQIDVMMILPKEQDFVNVHNFCYHVVQCPAAWDMT